MKTFRLRGLRLLLEEGAEPGKEKISMKEGLVINREEGGWWLVEAVIEKPDHEIFEKLSAGGSEVMMEVVISHENNEPATMVGKVRSIRALDQGFSVLIDGKMAMRKAEVYNYILESLTAEGFTGEELLTEFKKRRADRSNWSEQMARDLYAQYREQGSSPLDS